MIRTPYLTVDKVSVILTGINRVVVILIMGSVVTQQDIVLVGSVQTTDVYIEIGKNQEVHRSGDMTGSVVETTHYLTVQLVSVILMEINRVVVESGMESVVTLQDIVLVVPVQTTHVYTETGKNQEVQRSGDMTGSVVKTTHYLTEHLVSVILTVINRVVVSMDGVVKQQNIVLVVPVQTTHVYTEIGKNQEVHRSGDMTGGVVNTFPYRMEHLVSAILMGKNRVVVSTESVATVLQNIVLVVSVKITHVYTESGKNRKKSGCMMGSVVVATSYLTVHLVSVILTGINRVVVDGMECVVALNDIVLVEAVQTTPVYMETGKNQEVHRSGDMTESVVNTFPYLTVHTLSVILTGINRVVIVRGMESVVTLQDIVLVEAVQTTHVYTETGKNQEVHKSGDMTGSVVETTHYLTEHLVSVILMVRIRVVVVVVRDSVVTQQHIVLVVTVQTTHVCTKTGKNQEVHKSGDMTGSVVETTHYLTEHLVSVILTVINRVVVRMDGVVTQQKIVPVGTVQTTHVYTEIGMNQEVHRSGDMTGGVVNTFPYRTEHLVSVILMGKNRVVVSTESAVTVLQNIVLVVFVKITHVYTKNGKNGEKSGCMMGSVVVATPYLMVHLVSVILMGINRVVVDGMDCVVILHNIVLVEAVQTTPVYI